MEFPYWPSSFQPPPVSFPRFFPTRDPGAVAISQRKSRPYQSLSVPPFFYFSFSTHVPLKSFPPSWGLHQRRGESPGELPLPFPLKGDFFPPPPAFRCFKVLVHRPFWLSPRSPFLCFFFFLFFGLNRVRAHHFERMERIPFYLLLDTTFSPCLLPVCSRSQASEKCWFCFLSSLLALA